MNCPYCGNHWDCLERIHSSLKQVPVDTIFTLESTPNSDYNPLFQAYLVALENGQVQLSLKAKEGMLSGREACITLATSIRLSVEASTNLNGCLKRSPSAALPRLKNR